MSSSHSFALLSYLRVVLVVLVVAVIPGGVIIAIVAHDADVNQREEICELAREVNRRAAQFRVVRNATVRVLERSEDPLDRTLAVRVRAAAFAPVGTRCPKETTP